MSTDNYSETNARAIDAWVDDGWQWAVPISRKDYVAAGAGQWSVQ